MKHTVTIERDGVYLDGEKFFLLSGDFHYFRTLPGGWKRRLELMRDFGLTAVATYVPWNLHEPEKGVYNFDGNADLPRFLRECEESGLKVILRCSPYMCGEWEMGGLPSRLLKNRALCLRSSDPAFLSEVRHWLSILGNIVKPFLWTNGGPIILAGMENEYGSYGNDRNYLRSLSEIYRSCGIDVPLISANGADPFKYQNGTLPENWNGVDARATPKGIGDLELLAAAQPDKPLMAGEAWVGNIMFWGKSFTLDTRAEDHALYTKMALEKGAAINYYMFCGGTNFGFWSGSLRVGEGEKFTPLCTSYDYDAPIGEDGVPRKKYFLMRDEADRYFRRKPRAHILPAHEVQPSKKIRLDASARMFDNADVLADRSEYLWRTVPMEDLDASQGFIRYTAFVEYTDSRERVLILDGVADRATVYLAGRYIGTVMRDSEESGDIRFRVPEGGAELSILVENMGRVDYGYNLYDRKGLLGCVHFRIINPDGSTLWNFACLIGFQTETFSLSSIEGIRYREGVLSADGTPTFYRGRFSAKPGVDTYLDMKGWHKGIVWINGFNLGRYWKIGAQRTLYVPGELLQEENTVEVFEIHAPSPERTVALSEYAILDEVGTEDTSLSDFELK